MSRARRSGTSRREQTQLPTISATAFAAIPCARRTKRRAPRSAVAALRSGESKRNARTAPPAFLMRHEGRVTDEIDGRLPHWSVGWSANCRQKYGIRFRSSRTGRRAVRPAIPGSSRAKGLSVEPDYPPPTCEYRWCGCRVVGLHSIPCVLLGDGGADGQSGVDE